MISTRLLHRYSFYCAEASSPSAGNRNLSVCSPCGLLFTPNTSRILGLQVRLTRKKSYGILNRNVACRCEVRTRLGNGCIKLHCLLPPLPLDGVYGCETSHSYRRLRTSALLTAYFRLQNCPRWWNQWGKRLGSITVNVTGASGAAKDKIGGRFLQV